VSAFVNRRSEHVSVHCLNRECKQSKSFILVVNFKDIPSGEESGLTKEGYQIVLWMLLVCNVCVVKTELSDVFRCNDETDVMPLYQCTTPFRNIGGVELQMCILCDIR
jgi:hypothetical protein